MAATRPALPTPGEPFTARTRTTAPGPEPADPTAPMPAPADRPSNELASLLLAGRLVTEAALIRQESRGAHYRTDFPNPSDVWVKHIVFRNDA